MLQIACSPPPPSWFKLNLDGLVLQHILSATYDGILRDSMGRFISDFSANLCNCSTTMAEMWGIYIGLCAV